MLYKHEEIYRESRDPGLLPGFRAESRSAWGNGWIAQRYYDAYFDEGGKNLSYRIQELWLVGAGFRWDEVRWVDATGRERFYLDATVLFGAFGYTRIGDDNRDVILLWIPFPLP